MCDFRLWPAADVVDCGLYGHCMPESESNSSFYCACDGGWQGEGDLVFWDGDVCSIQDWWRYIWSFTLFVSVIAVHRSGRCLWHRLRALRARPEADRSRDGRCGPLGDNCFQAFLFSTVFSSFSIITAIMKLATDESIGHNAPVTVSFSCTAVSFFEALNSSLFLYLDMLTSTTRLRDQTFKENCARFKMRTRGVIKMFVRPLIIVGATMPMFCLAAESIEVKTTLGQLHYMLSLVCIVILRSVTLHFMRWVIHVWNTVGYYFTLCCVLFVKGPKT